MDSTRARTIRDARQESVLSRLINKAKNDTWQNDTWAASNVPVKHWFLRLQSESGGILEGSMPTQAGGPPREYAFFECASMLYNIRMVLQAHPDYQVFTADPLVRTQVDTVSRFYCLSNASLHSPLCEPSSQSMTNDGGTPSNLLSILKLTTSSTRTDYETTL